MILRGLQSGERPRSRDHRAYERFDLGDEHGSLIYGGARTACQLVDISLGGCCLRTDTPFSAGALAPVEVALPICGMTVRVRGITQWTKLQYLVGVRFIHPDARSKNLLAGVLTCLADGSAAELVREAIAAEVAAGSALWLPTPSLAVELPGTEPQNPAPAAAPEDDKEQAVAAAPVADTSATVEEPALEPGESDWSAVLHFLKDGTQMAGVVANLRLDGCSVRTAELFIAGIHIRVEVEFRIRGLCLRLGGVTEAVHDQHMVEIRFLHLSHRKGEQLAQVLEEIGGVGGVQAEIAGDAAG